MEARLAVTSTDTFDEPNHLFGALTPRNQKVGCALVIAARAGMVVEIERNDRSSQSVESHRDRTIMPFQAETASSLHSLKYCG
jgi:hypothetical protein